ncbi:AEC family transporter [Flavobacterium reichenbachii]|uniref:Transporter n=1 Tax=Flavobacterium reichenbachii TaxID=362418 RepID=A0A085ZDB0_9FLAO|nr:AEC family transporter [Flavobacterium reichenbachii]KFF02424.1 transporter [Flavobacterium reichenbachii]OXB13599.1 transporter [Flavobacterium reichenbachii]
MNNFILIFFFLFLGLLLQRVKRFPTHIYKVLNKIVIYFCLPAITLYHIPKIKWSNDLLFPIGAGWITFVLAFFFFHFLGKRLGWSKKLTGCLILTAGLSNSSFLGYPIIEALFGKRGLETAVLVDQPGTFVVVSTLGVFVAAFYSKGTPDTFGIIKKIILFPPFLTFITACLLNIFEYNLNDSLQSVLLKIGSLVTPLALLSVGLQLTFDRKSQHWKFLKLGLFYRLIFAPLIIFVLYVFVFKQNSEEIKITIMEMAMAPMITGAILASTYGLKPKLSSMMIGFGIPISFVTLAVWYFVLSFI